LVSFVKKKSINSHPCHFVVNWKVSHSSYSSRFKIKVRQLHIGMKLLISFSPKFLLHPYRTVKHCHHPYICHILYRLHHPEGSSISHLLMQLNHQQVIFLRSLRMGDYVKRVALIWWQCFTMWYGWGIKLELKE
jgi:hypothetical protein